jgi:putative glycosyltransferase (TIGR04372 family)
LSGYKKKLVKLFIADSETRGQLLKRAAVYYLTLIIAPVIVLLIDLFRPLIKVRIGWLMYLRLGNLSSNTEFYLRRCSRKNNKVREVCLFVGGVVTGKPANKQLFQMIKRKLPVLDNRLAEQLGIQIIRKRPDLRVDMPFFYNRNGVKGDAYNEWNSCEPQLSFTEEEEKYGKELLASMGIGSGAKYICFFNRSHEYLDVVHSYRSREEWNYQDFRDCRIDYYMPAAEFLAQQGLFALRTGYLVDQKLPVSRYEKIIDYASDYRSDFGDIYVHAHCYFVVGSSTGMLPLAECFNIPIALANTIPFTGVPIGERSLFIPKKLWDIQGKRLLTFQEILASDIHSASHGDLYKNTGIEVIENSADEIVALTREMYLRLEGHWCSAEEDEELQSRFRGLFSSEHMCFGFRARIGTEFLRQHKELLD